MTAGARAMRLARETVEVAREVEPDAPCDDDRQLELELFWVAGYEQALRDMKIALARWPGGRSPR